MVAEQLPQQRRKCFGVGERLHLPVEAEFAGSECLPESGHKLGPKHASEHLNREQEPIARLDPAGVIGRQSASGNDAMNVRVIFDLLIPGMQHAEEADLGAETARCARDFEQGFGAGTKQQVVDKLLVL